MKKVISMDLRYLGSLKQAPFLIKEINKIIPETKIIAYTRDYATDDLFGKKILLEDLNREGINLENIKIYEHTNSSEKNGLNLDFIVSKGYKFYQNSNEMEFWIDPLKFEKRKLLDENKIKLLKDKYKVNSPNVVVAGSIREEETSTIFLGTQELLNSKPDYKIIIVPRKDPGIICDNIARISKLPIETDEKIIGNSNYLIITEKGILEKLYSICKIAIMGDTFYPRGRGQNPLEPAFYGKKIISGENYENNGVAYRGLEKSGLLKRVSRENLGKELLKEISGNQLKIYQENAQRFIESKQGAAKVYAEIIKEALEGKLTFEDFKNTLLKLP